MCLIFTECITIQPKEEDEVSKTLTDVIAEIEKMVQSTSGIKE